MGIWCVWPVDGDGREVASVSVVEAESAGRARAAADRDLPLLRDMPQRAGWKVAVSAGEHVFTHNGPGPVIHYTPEGADPLCGWMGVEDGFTVVVSQVSCGDCVAALEGTLEGAS